MKRRRALTGLAVLGFLLALASGAFVEVGRWFQFTEEPVPADLIVILGGDPSRALKAAELYKAGFAPEIWMPRDFREAYFRHLDSIDVVLPKEELIVKNALVKHGVPGDKVKFFGKDTLSTLEEAQALRQALGPGLKKIIIVTGLTHTRRAKMLFGWVFPGSRLTAVADGSEEYARNWWAHKFVAEHVIKEATAAAYLVLGGIRLNHEP